MAIPHKMPVDGNNLAIQASKTLVYQTSSIYPLTPLTSPQAVTSATLVLNPPDNALTCMFRPDQNVTFSNTVDQSAGIYVASANSDCRVPCADGKPIYILCGSTTTNIYFAFEMI